MKKFILPLMLLLFVGSLFAVESDPSEVVGYVKYDILAGNNMLAIPMETDFEWASELGDHLGVTSVSIWNNQNQAFDAANYIELFTSWDGDFAIDSGSVLMINATESGAFFSLGGIPSDPTYTIVAGNNTVMIPLSRSDIDMASVLGDEIGASVVSTWNNVSQAFDAANYIELFTSWDGDFATSIGDPLMINANEAGVFQDALGRTINTKATKK